MSLAAAAQGLDIIVKTWATSETIRLNAQVVRLQAQKVKLSTSGNLASKATSRVKKTATLSVGDFIKTT